MAGARRRTIEWEPRSIDELADRRRRVKPTHWPDIPLAEAFFAVAMVAIPLTFVFGSPGPANRGILAALLFFLLFAAAFVHSRQGVYLSRAGVTVQRGFIPRESMPWEEVARFELVRRRLPLGGGEREVVILVTASGRVVPSWFFQRDPEFESHRLPVESAKAFLRSFPDLVDQLNRITAEVRAGS